MFEGIVMNGAGTCKYLEDVERMARSDQSAIMVGSITLERRQGNAGNVFWLDGLFALNSKGLPNPGIEYYTKVLPEMVKIAHSVAKPLFVSVAGFSVSEYVELVRVSHESGADHTEINLSCPNVREQRGIACFDPLYVSYILKEVRECVGSAKLSVKISPFADPVALSGFARMVSAFDNVEAVTAVNSFPNALMFNSSGTESISGGLAGLSGYVLKPIGLGHVRQLKESLGDRVSIIGVGGICNGLDVADYRRSGADAVQVVTELIERGEGVFSDILRYDLSGA